jgi:hypothetical protein
MAVDTHRVESSSLGATPIPPEEGEVAENLRILHTREAKLMPLFAVLQHNLNQAKKPQDREAIRTIISILEVTPLETINVAENVLEYTNKRRRK